MENDTGILLSLSTVKTSLEVADMEYVLEAAIIKKADNKVSLFILLVIIFIKSLPFFIYHINPLI
jgi:hypothetical protein